VQIRFGLGEGRQRHEQGFAHRRGHSTCRVRHLDIAGYMYDDAGNSVWYLTTGPIGGSSTARSFTGNWWSFGNGQTLTGAWKPHAQLSDNVAPVTIQFNGIDTATMTLPGGRTTILKRHRF
jgi:hypothetical protein